MECARKGSRTLCCGPSIRRCHRCLVVAYCSLSHQVSHRSAHKRECERLEQQMKCAGMLNDFPFTFSQKVIQEKLCSHLTENGIHCLGMWMYECSCGVSNISFDNKRLIDGWNLPSELCPCKVSCTFFLQIFSGYLLDLFNVKTEEGWNFSRSRLQKENQKAKITQPTGHRKAPEETFPVGTQVQPKNRRAAIFAGGDSTPSNPIPFQPDSHEPPTLVAGKISSEIRKSSRPTPLRHLAGRAQLITKLRVQFRTTSRAPLTPPLVLMGVCV